MLEGPEDLALPLWGFWRTLVGLGVETPVGVVVDSPSPARYEMSVAKGSKGGNQGCSTIIETGLPDFN